MLSYRCIAWSVKGLAKRRSPYLVMIGLLWCGLSVAETEGPTSLTFDEALELAQARVPMLKARAAAADAARDIAVSAGRLPDPKLGVGIDNLPIEGPDRFSTSRDFMTMRRLSWMQEMPNASKRKARGEVAQARADVVRSQFTADRQAVKRETALAWLLSHLAERRLVLFADIERENRLLQDTLNARIAAGRTPPADAVMARQESLLLADRRDELDRDRAKARAALKRWIGDDAQRPIAENLPAFDIDAKHILDHLQHHAELLVYEPMTRMAAADVREAEAEKKSDWSWEMSYGNRGPSYGDMVSFQLAFDLPLFASKRQEPQITAKRKEVERIAAERDDMFRQHVAEVESELAELERLSRVLTRTNDSALPLAARRVELQLASYRSGRGDLAAVLAARRDLAETRLKAVEIEYQQIAVRARLAYVLQEEHP